VPTSAAVGLSTRRLWLAWSNAMKCGRGEVFDFILISKLISFYWHESRRAYEAFTV
jgi:hypothetical protein